MTITVLRYIVKKTAIFFIPGKEFFMKKAVFVPIFAILTACALIPDYFSERPPERNPLKASQTYTLTPYQYEPTIYLGEKIVEQKNYELNRREYVRTGESVIRVKSFRQRAYKHFFNEFMLKHDVTLTFGIENFKIPAGIRHIQGVIDLDGETYYVLDSTDRYHMLMTPDFYLSNLAVYEKSAGVFTKLYEKIVFTPSGKTYLPQKTDETSDSTPLDDYEIVYDGVKDNKLTFFYKRSIIGSNGNAGSFETLTYPADSATINLMGILVQIIRADGDHIEYIMLKKI